MARPTKPWFSVIRFQCGHCGHRIAIQPRHLGNVLICPDCGQSTHPIAEQVIRRRAVATPGTALQPTVYTCANCFQTIGRLQKIHLWDNKVVCGQCHRKLSDELAPRQPATTTITPVVAKRAVPVMETERSPATDAVVAALTRPFRGGLFGALVGLCVAGAALYGALTLLKDVAGLVTGLAVAALALFCTYLGVRAMLGSRRVDTRVRTLSRLELPDQRRSV